jgi:tRNA dimethylallyltransferase
MNISNTSIPVLVIMGPTAAGKTDLAVAIARELPVDIISVDSALVYRGMDIGTAKPPPDVLAEFPHRLIDIRDPAEAYSAANFRSDALREIEASFAAGRIPLLVGGTMLYFRALFSGLSALPSADPVVRARLDAEAVSLGWAAMHERLTAVDPIAGQKIHRNDPQRIQRALEVYEISGVPWSELCAAPPPLEFPYRISSVIIAPNDRGVLHDRIAQRFDAMLAQGFIDEVEKLRARGDLHLGLPALRAVGYRQAWQYLDGHCDFTTMCYRAVAATRQLAKRQLTWLRRDWGAQWFDGSGEELVQQVLKSFAVNIK